VLFWQFVALAEADADEAEDEDEVPTVEELANDELVDDELAKEALNEEELTDEDILDKELEAEIMTKLIVDPEIGAGLLRDAAGDDDALLEEVATLEDTVAEPCPEIRAAPLV
jgi:hypothetical protein